MTTLPSNISFGTVRGRFGTSALTAGDADGYPNLEPMVGLTITFTAGTPTVLDRSASPDPVTILMDPVVCTVDDNGYLLGPDGLLGVHLIATDDPDIDPHGDWTYNVTYGGAAAAKKLDSFNMTVPTGSARWITNIGPVPSSNGVSLTQAEAAEQAAVTAAAAAAISAASLGTQVADTQAAAANALTSKTAAAGSATAAAGSATGAGVSATSATGSATSATASATSATASKNAAATSAAAASTSATAATGSVTASGVNATAAAGSATAAATSATAAAASAASVVTPTIDTLTGVTTVGKAVAKAADATAARTAIALGSVDNTADAAKPLSTADVAALALKAPLASPTFTGPVAGVTKAHVGLSLVDNTADASKPVSTAQQTALNLKAVAPTAFTMAAPAQSWSTGVVNVSLTSVPTGRPVVGGINGTARPFSGTYIVVQLFDGATNVSGDVPISLGTSAFCVSFARVFTNTPTLRYTLGGSGASSCDLATVAGLAF